LSGSDPADTFTWDFGDASTANTQEYDKTYATAGVYVVTLTVTNTAGSNTYLYYITVFTDTGGIIPIVTQVSYKIPQEALNAGQVNYLIKKWQLYLQPQVNPNPIEDVDVYTEASWPPPLQYPYCSVSCLGLHS
jgi:PKD repeat protein